MSKPLVRLAVLCLVTGSIISFFLGAFGIPFVPRFVILLAINFLLACVYETSRRLHHKKPAQLEAPKSGLERIKEDYALGKISYAMLLFTIERELAFQTPPLPEPPKLPLPALPKPQEITVPAPDPARVAYPSILARVQQYQRENAPHE